MAGGDTRPLRVLVITNMYPSQQHPHSGVFVSRQVRSLDQAGVTTKVICVDRESRRGMLSYAGLARRVRDASSRFQPDLVHVMYGGIMALLVAFSRLDQPVIVSFCGSDIHGQPNAPPLRRMIARVGVWCSRAAAKRASGVIVKSEELKVCLPEVACPVRVIPNGIDLDAFRPRHPLEARRELGWSEDGLHVLFYDSSDPLKRADLARAAFAKLRGGLRAELHRMWGIAPDEVPTWLNASSVLLVTSAREGSPNVVKEALACNVPVVSVDVGDVRERLDGVEWCTIADDNPQALAKAMSELGRAPRRTNGRPAVEGLRLEAVAKRICDLYEIVRRAPSHSTR